MDTRPTRPLDDDGLPRLTVFGVADCEDTAVVRDRLRALGVPFLDVDLDHDPDADAYVRDLHAGHRVTPTVVLGVEAEVVAEPALETVDRLAAAAWPDLPISRPVLARLHGEPVGRAIEYADLDVAPLQDGAAAPGIRLAGMRGRHQVALLLAHDAGCLVCLGYARRLVATTPELAEASARMVIVGRDDPDGLAAAWRPHLPPGTALLADPGGSWTGRVLDRLVPAPGAPGSLARYTRTGAALLLLDRYGAPRAIGAGADAGSLVAPSEVASWLAYLEIECGSCASDMPGWDALP